MNDKSIRDLLEEAANSEPLMWHPIEQRNEKAWFPSNEAANLVVLIAYAWEDLVLLQMIRDELSGERERRLLFKYALVELRSIVELIERLQSVIFRVIGDRSHRPHGYISEDEERVLRTLFKEYHSTKKLVEHDLLEIRNKIGAHRGLHWWGEIVALWDRLEPEPFRPLLKIIPTLFEVIRQLDIYDWTCTPEKGTMAFCCSGLKDIEPW